MARRLGFGFLVFLVAVLLVLNVLAWTGGLVGEPDPATEEPAAIGLSVRT